MTLGETGSIETAVATRASLAIAGHRVNVLFLVCVSYYWGTFLHGSRHRALLFFFFSSPWSRILA